VLEEKWFGEVTTESAVAAWFGHAGHLALTSPWLSPSSSSRGFLAEMERGVQDCLSLGLGTVSGELNGRFQD